MDNYLHDKLDRIEDKLDAVLDGLTILARLIDGEEEDAETDLDGEPIPGERDGMTML